MKFILFAFFSTIGSMSGILLSWDFPIQAQVVPDRTLGSESSVVTPNVNIRGIPSDAPEGAATLRIDGGAVRGGNLFHSFQEFNIDVGRGVYFSNPDNIINILTRVTGGNISEILGTLGVLGNANFFLINPNGIVFGPNARLDVGGSFFASTADGILFENGFEFAASNPEAPPLLTINMPLGLNIRENPATIQVRGSGHNLSFDEGTGAIIRENRPVGLQVPENQILALIGGDILLEGGNLTATDGRVELGSVSGSGTVTFTPQLNEPLNYNEISTFGQVQLSQAASVEVSGNRGGDINVYAGNVEVIDGSAMLSGTLGSGTGGVLTIRASESLELNGTTLDNQFASSLFADIAPDATGQGSNLNITTGSLRVVNGAQIAANTVGAGNGGEVNITANDVEVVGTSADGQFSSSLAASVNSGATGNGGNLTINAQNLRVFDGARITGGTLGEGDGGSLTLNTQNLLLRNRAGIVASTFGAGDGGSLAINTGTLSIADGSGIAASTFGTGDGGELTVTATNIELMTVSALSASVEQNATGDGGTLTVNTQRLLIQDRSQILAVVFGNGNGRDLTVNAADIELVGTGSGLFASVNPGATGKGGDVTINTQRLTIRDGAQILESVVTRF